MRAWWVVWITVGCATDHAHDHEIDDEHVVRDPATEPCDATNWASLFPDLRQCDLGGVVLDAAPLRRVDLSEATLVGASLVGADLFKASFRAANLANANLAGAKLTSADLTDSDLTGASLVGANLTNAALAGATTAGALTDATTICVSGTPGPCW